MKKIREFLLQQKVKWKYSEETVPLYARKSIKLGIGLVFILFGGFIITKNLLVLPNKYEDVTSQPAIAIKALEPTNHNKKIALILYRDDCKACKNVESKLVALIKKKKDKTSTSIIVANINDMTQEELKIIPKKLPDVMIEDNKIPTPLVANLTINTDGKIKVTEQSNTDDYKKIHQVFDDI